MIPFFKWGWEFMKICTNCGNKLRNEEKKCSVCKMKSKDFPIVDDNDTERIQEIIDAVKTKHSSQNIAPKKRKGKGCLIAFVLIIFLAVAGALAQMGSGDDAETISLEEFNQIQAGMTYDQVKAIIGSDGELISDVDIGMGEQYHTVIYTWYGNKTTGANANFTFQGGKLLSKAQIGLK